MTGLSFPCCNSRLLTMKTYCTMLSIMHESHGLKPSRGGALLADVPMTDTSPDRGKHSTLRAQDDACKRYQERMVDSSLWRIRDCATDAGPQLADGNGLVPAILENRQPDIHGWDVVFPDT